MATELATQPTSQTEWPLVLELSTREVFELMVGCTAQTVPSTERHEPYEFTAMVGLAGQLCGVISLRGSFASAAHIASKMLGTNVLVNDPQGQDAVAEICNMIAGNFKSKLSGTGRDCMLSVPTVITGADYQLRSLGEGEVIEHHIRIDQHLLSIGLEVHT